jgi:hypothetical protein
MYTLVSFRINMAKVRFCAQYVSANSCVMTGVKLFFRTFDLFFGQSQRVSHFLYRHVFPSLKRLKRPG